jgi:hypothetical protein
MFEEYDRYIKARVKPSSRVQTTQTQSTKNKQIKVFNKTDTADPNKKYNEILIDGQRVNIKKPSKDYVGWIDACRKKFKVNINDI